MERTNAAANMFSMRSMAIHLRRLFRLPLRLRGGTVTYQVGELGLRIRLTLPGPADAALRKLAVRIWP